MLGISTPFGYRLRYLMTAPQPREYMYSWFRLLPFRSPLLGESRLISSPRGTEMFHFPRFATQRYVFTLD